MTRPSKSVLAGCAVFLALFFVYLRHCAPTIGVGDSAELAAAAAVGGVAHSPGYPAYVLAAKNFQAVAHWGNPAFRAALFSGFCTALAFALLAGGPWNAAGFLGAAGLLLAGLSPLIARLSLNAEVFGLNLLAASVLAWTASSPRPGRWMLTALAFGLACGNQQTILFTAPLWAGLCWWSDPAARPTARRLVAAGAALLAGLSIYGYLYLRSRAQPLLDWEDPETLSRWWDVVTRARYGTLQLAQGAPSPRTWARLGAQCAFFARELAGNFGWAGTAVLVFGVARAAAGDRSARRKWVLWLAAVALAGPLFLFWSNVAPSDRTREILERFLLLPVFLSCAFVPAALSAPGRRFAALGLVALAAWTAEAAARTLPGARWDLLARDHGVNVLRSTPAGARLFSDRADETEFSLAYLLDVELTRPDVEFIDCNAGVSRSIYGDDYYGIWGAPRLMRRDAVESRLVMQPRPAFYATLDTGQISIPRRAAGLLYEASPDGAFSGRTSFPYWTVMTWRSYRDVSTSRGRHLVESGGRLLGDYALALGRPADAAAPFRFAERAGGAPAALHLAAWHQQRGHFAEAETLYRKLVLRPESRSVSWNNLGVLYSSKNRWRDALDCYARALDGDPSYFEAYYNRGVAHWNLGEWKEVASDFENCLRIRPDHPSARRFLEQARLREHRG